MKYFHRKSKKDIWIECTSEEYNHYYYETTEQTKVEAT